MKTVIQFAIRFCKDWTLPISMIIGILSYFIYRSMGFSEEVRAITNSAIGIIQPVLLFFMLFLAFCKIDPSKIRLKTWHIILGIIQLCSFIGLAIITCYCDNRTTQIILECAMCCMICPTATAAIVIVDKLGGNKLTLVTYTITSNTIASIIIPLIVPIVNPGIGMSFIHSFLIIIKQVFPLLVFPFFLAWGVRVFTPKLLDKLLQVKDLAFYLWVVSLALALAVTTKAIVHSGVSFACMCGIAIVTLFCCLIQFFLGKKIGNQYDDKISGGQALGQKSTVFMIWMGATFLNPVTAVAGGFYSVWHNMVNSIQLYQKRHAQNK